MSISSVVRGLLLMAAAACSSAKLAEPPEFSASQGNASHSQAADEPATCTMHDHTEAPAPQPREPGALQLIRDPSQLCMVRDHFMGRPQLPVEIDGSTYYGCCEGCRQRLAHDPIARTAIDPVSHRAIDKALAVVGVNERGGVLYFENEANLRAYAVRSVD